MRVTKLLSVSVTLWAVVVGADSASAGSGPIVTPSIRVVPPTIKPPLIKPVTSSIKPVTPSITPKVWMPPIRGQATSLQPSIKPLQSIKSQTSQGHRRHAGGRGSPSGDVGAGSPPSGDASPSGASGAGSPPPKEGTEFSFGAGSPADAAGGGNDGGRPARNFAPPASYNSRTACGRYPYPACQ